MRDEVATGVKVNASQHELLLNLKQICAHSIITVSDATKDTQLGLALLGQHRVGALQINSYTCNQQPGIHTVMKNARLKERLVFPAGFDYSRATFSLPNAYKLKCRWHVGADRRKRE